MPARDHDGLTEGTEKIMDNDGKAGRYSWTGWECDTDMSGDGSGDPDRYLLTVRDPEGEEYAHIVHRTNGGTYPIDGPMAREKEGRAQRIVDALNAES